MNIRISSSAVPMPAIPKLSASTFITLGERNAGSVGPRWMFLTPRYRSARSTNTAFCSYHEILYTIGSSFISFPVPLVCSRSSSRSVRSCPDMSIAEYISRDPADPQALHFSRKHRQIHIPCFSLSPDIDNKTCP